MIELFHALENNQTVISLDISSKDRTRINKIEESGIQQLAKLLQKSNFLSFIDLSLLNLGNKGLKKLSEGLIHNSVALTLIIKNNNLSNNSVDTLFQVVTKSSLEHLDIAFNHFDDSSIIELSKWLQEKIWKLRILNMTSWGITNESIVKFVNSVKHNSTLQTLILDQNDLSGPNISSLKKMIAQNSSLKKISLQKCNLKNDGAMAVAKGYSNNLRVTSINLQQNEIGDEGASFFVKALKVYRTNYLKVLNLSDNLISQELAHKLVKVVQNKDQPVTYINLEDNLTKAKSDDLLGFFVDKNRSSPTVSRFKNQNRIKKLNFTYKQMKREKILKSADKSKSININNQSIKSTKTKIKLFKDVEIKEQDKIIKAKLQKDFTSHVEIKLKRINEKLEEVYKQVALVNEVYLKVSPLM